MKRRALFPLALIMLLAVLQPSIIRTLGRYLHSQSSPPPASVLATSVPVEPIDAATNAVSPRWAQYPTDTSDDELPLSP